MAKTNDPGRARPGRLRGLGGWLLVVLAMPGIAAVVETAFADPDAPTDEEERPFAQVARDELHSPVWGLAFSPDGSRLALSTISGDVWLFDEARGLRTSVAHGRAAVARSLAFSPDGRVLAIGTPGRVVRLVDASSASEMEPLKFDGEDDASYVAISLDGRYLAAGGSAGTVMIWDWVSRKRLGALVGRDSVTALGFAPDGATLAVGDVTGRVSLWAVPAGVERLTLVANAPRQGVTSLAFSPDGTSLAAASKLDRVCGSGAGPTAAPAGRSRAHRRTCERWPTRPTAPCWPSPRRMAAPRCGASRSAGSCAGPGERAGAAIRGLLRRRPIVRHRRQ